MLEEGVVVLKVPSVEDRGRGDIDEAGKEGDEEDEGERDEGAIDEGARESCLR